MIGTFLIPVVAGLCGMLAYAYGYMCGARDEREKHR